MKSIWKALAALPALALILILSGCEQPAETTPPPGGGGSGTGAGAVQKPDKGAVETPGNPMPGDTDKDKGEDHKDATAPPIEGPKPAEPTGGAAPAPEDAK